VLRRPLESAQYTAVIFGQRCEQFGIDISMGSIGDCYDNAVCEAFHSTSSASSFTAVHGPPAPS
jgi:transposase InsO family protein